MLSYRRIATSKRAPDLGPELEFDLDKRPRQPLTKQGPVSDVGQFGQDIVFAVSLDGGVHA